MKNMKSRDRPRPESRTIAEPEDSKPGLMVCISEFSIGYKRITSTTAASYTTTSTQTASDWYGNAMVRKGYPS